MTRLEALEQARARLLERLAQLERDIEMERAQSPQTVETAALDVPGSVERR